MSRAGTANAVVQHDESDGEVKGERVVVVETRHWRALSASGQAFSLREDQSLLGLHGARLAGVRAWLNLAQLVLADGHPHDASDCARRGLAELGEDYADFSVEDDTSLKLAAADDLQKNGRDLDAATLRVRILSNRVELLAEKYGLGSR